MINDRLRIIDANVNRLGEGLRVLEEFARMTLNDADLTQKLKNIRHKTVRINKELNRRLLSSRDAAGDIGSSMGVEGGEDGRDAEGIIAANAKRAQESLRVLEEMAKIPELNLDSGKYRRARFELYTIEKELVAKVSRKEKLGRLKGIYAIIDTAWLKERNHKVIARQVIKGGAGVIQLRCKEKTTGGFFTIASDLKEICRQNNIIFIVNDSLEVALACKADGIHIGREDLPVETAKELMPVDMILGCSVRTIDEALAAIEDGADYLGVGAIFATTTKETAHVVGIKRIKEIKKAVDIPIVAIGGINKGNLSKVMKAGADAAAVISAIMGATDVEESTRELVNIIGEN